MKILLADPEFNVRYGLTVLLEEQSGLEIVGEAAHASELFVQIQGLCPDLLLLSWELPGDPAVELIRGIREACPNLYILVLSARTEFRQAALFAGADGFISKAVPPELLLAEIRSAMRKK